MDYDTWKLASARGREAVVTECEYCSGEVYEGEEAYEIDLHSWVHQDCFRDYAEGELNAKIKTAKRR